MRCHKRKSVKVSVFEVGGSLRVQILGGWRRRRPTVGVRKRDCAFTGIKVSAMYVLSFCHKAHVTDGQTELRQLYRASVRYMRRAVNSTI